MFGIKKIIQRLKSLEDYLGVIYSKPDDKYEFPEHYTNGDYGRMSKLDKIKVKRK